MHAHAELITNNYDKLYSFITYFFITDKVNFSITKSGIMKVTNFHEHKTTVGSVTLTNIIPNLIWVTTIGLGTSVVVKYVNNVTNN